MNKVKHQREQSLGASLPLVQCIFYACLQDVRLMPKLGGAVTLGADDLSVAQYPDNLIMMLQPFWDMHMRL